MVIKVEKTELFYIVLVGSNDRAQTIDELPLIVKPESVDDTLDKCKELAEMKGFTTYEFEAITIEEYERTFTERVEW